ncbi:glycoside hydrolase [Chitinophaga filiformis]|uniref:Glucuronoarabinoxylan endo-1,4-beta-xylanase n=1 Tax=Chitinophaga filiformis TaxID=104663 RepID=A0A1G7SAE3_CHIFI|nr:glucuronoxylanase [Chitinophaga filiformis]SDG20027.1 glucuronoarabinoxylan endo-1,4-beta-xylanase [Chitinophaga filiformis]
MKTTLSLKHLAMPFLSLCLIMSSCTRHLEDITPDSKELNNAGSAADVGILATATIDANTVQQTIQGFGGMSVPIWIGDLTADQRTKAFSTSSGIGMSILRVMVPPNSSQFAAEKATIDAAKSYGAKVIATAWNAPSSMMDRLYLRASAWADYAAHLRAYTQAVGGVYALSPWNEPNYLASEWMHASATEIANFVAAQGDNCGAPIMSPEPFNMDQTFINTYLSNATAKSKTLFVSGHIYGKTPYNLGNIGKSVWMTEHYTNSSISGNDWPNAMNAAKEIHDCMTAGWAAYVWWYIRRFYGPIDESSNITKVGYVIAHFARYVRPGYTKIACSANPSTGVYTTAYKSGSKIVVVAINTNAAITYQPFTISGVTVNSFNRYVTTSSSNLAASSFSISNNAFGINLPASSITTLVSN